MKRVLSLIMVLAMVLAMVPAVLAADESILDTSVTAEADSKYTYTYTPSVDGTLTVTVGDGTTNWSSDVMYFDASFNIVSAGSASGSAEATYTAELTAGTTYRIRVWETDGGALAATPVKAAFAAAAEEDFGQLLSSGTASCHEQTFTGEGKTWTEFVPEEVKITAPANGTVTVKASVPTDNTGADEIAWRCEALSVKFPESGTTDGTYRFEVYKDMEYTVTIGAYDSYDDGDGHSPHYDAGTVDYEIYFQGGEVELKDYVVSGHVPMDVEVDDAMILWYKDAGENREYTPASVFSGEAVVNVDEDYTVEADPTAKVTIFPFEPAMDANGVYKFTAPEGVTLTYWGTQSAMPALQEKDSTLADNVIYATVDNGIWNLCKPVVDMMGTPSEDPNEWYWLWSSSQMLIGVEGASGEVVLNIEKTEALESLEADISGEDTPNYTIRHVPNDSFYNLSDDAVLEFVNLEEEHTAVKGEDGYYHLDTVDGPIVYVDTETSYISLSTLVGAMAMNVTYVNDNGETVKENFKSAMSVYADKLAATDGIYPLTRDLEIFLTHYGWQQNMESLPYDPATADANTVLMSVCCIEAGAAGGEDETVLAIGQNEIAVPAEGATYTYTAEEAGNLNIRVADCDMPGYVLEIAVNGEDAAVVEYADEELFTDGLPVAVEAGDEVSVLINTMDADNAPVAGNVTMNVVYAAEAVVSSATITFDSTSKRTEFTTSKQVWVENGITVTNNKGKSTTNVADYSKPARFYKSSQLIIACAGNITQIVVDCNSSSYATALQNSIDKATATVSVSSDKVTITPVAAANSYTIESLTGGQVRVDGMTVSYKAAACAHDNIENVAADAATCTEVGYTAGVYCNDCEIYIHGHELITATGHSYVVGDMITCENCDLEEEIISLADAAEIAADAGSKYTTDKYFVKGVITDVANTQYGNLYIEDENGDELYIYGVWSADGNTRYDALEVKPVEGDTVILTGVLGTYTNSNTNVTTNQMKNSWLVEHTVYVPCEHTATTPVDNEDGATHNLVCDECGEVAEENVPHNYVDGACACGAKDPNASEDPDVITGSFSVESYGNADWTAPATGSVTFTGDGAFMIYKGWDQMMQAPAETFTMDVNEGEVYTIFNEQYGVNINVTYTYGEGGEDEPTLPAGMLSVESYSSGTRWIAPATGNVTFTADGEFVLLDSTYAPVAEMVTTITVDVNEGDELYFVETNGVGLTVNYAYNSVEGGDVETVYKDLNIGYNSIEQKDVNYKFTATEAGILTLSLSAQSVGGTVEVQYAVNGENVQPLQNNYAELNLVSGNVVTVNVTATGYNTLVAAWYPTTEDPAELELGDNEVEAPAGLTGGSWTYTPAEDGKLTVTVTALSYSDDEGATWTEVPAEYFANQFGRGSYNLSINGENAYAATATVDVTADTAVTVSLSSMTGNPVKATINLAVAAGGEDGEGSGTWDDPYVITELPYTINKEAYADVYYVWTATQDCQISASYFEGGIIDIYDADYTLETVSDEANMIKTAFVTEGMKVYFNAYGEVAGAYELKVVPHVAEIGEAKYYSVSEALEAAKSGETVTLVADAVESYVIITPGVTLDLGANTLTADYVIGLSGSAVTAARHSAAGVGGKLVVDKDAVSLSTATATGSSDTLKVLPIWMGDCYMFMDARIDMVKAVAENGMTTLEFFPNATSYVRKNLFKENGSSQYGVSMIIRVEWTEEQTNGDVKVSKEYFYTDDLIKNTYGNNASGSNVNLAVDMDGCDELKDLVFTVAMVTDAGAEITSQSYTYEELIAQ